MNPPYIYIATVTDVSAWDEGFNPRRLIGVKVTARRDDGTDQREVTWKIRFDDEDMAIPTVGDRVVVALPYVVEKEDEGEAE